MERTECRYCDNPLPPRDYDGDLVCSNCGAEWAAAKIEFKVSEEQLQQEQAEMEEYYREYGTDHGTLY